MKKYKILKICSGIFMILFAVLHIWLSFWSMVIFGIMEGWVVNATDAEHMWLGSGLWLGAFLFISGILVFREKKRFALAACAADFIYWLVPLIAGVAKLDRLQGISAFFSIGNCLALCMANAVELICLISLWKMKNKQEQPEALRKDLEEGK